MYVQILLGDPDGNLPTWEDAYNWAYEYDHDGDCEIGCEYEPPIGILVLADTDRGLWNAYRECGVTPQMFIIDQGGLMVDDACTYESSEVECFLSAACGSERARGQGILDSILPPAWCGESDP
jgi:hypothetical protein